MKASDLLVQALENEGVEYIFGIPGEENLDFLNSLKDSSIKLVLTRHEQAAAFIAATYGRLTGKTGVCLSTLGPGATNFVTGTAYAQLGGMPLLMISGQKPIKKSKQGRFQILEVVDLMTPITKWSRQVVNGGNIPSMVRECFRIAEEERPGAVYLELPEDIAREEVDSHHLFKPSVMRRPLACDRSIDAAVKTIEQAKMPLLLIAAGANRKRIKHALDAFINKTGMYFFDTQMGMGVVDERHEKFLGTAALSDNDYVHHAIEHADVIINVGHDVVEKPPFFMQENGRTVIHVNFSSAQVDEVYFPQIELIGDIANAMYRITERIEPQEHWDNEYYSRVKEDVESHISEKHDDPRFPIIPQRIVSDVRAAMPTDGIVTLDNGIYKVWFARNYKAHLPNTLLLDNALATMGAGLPSGIAAKMFNPDKKVMSICGDGGFMMNSQELETAVRLGIDMVVVILRDNAYGMIKWKQAGMGFDPFGLDYGNPDFVKYAESYGAKGIRIESTESFLPTLKDALDSKGVTLIEAPVDYTENERVLIEELENKTSKISPPKTS